MELRCGLRTHAALSTALVLLLVVNFKHVNAQTGITTTDIPTETQTITDALTTDQLTTNEPTTNEPTTNEPTTIVPTTEIQTTTLPVPDQPTNVNVIDYGTDYITVNWTHSGEHVDEFVITAIATENEAANGTETVNITRGTVDGLTPGAEYTITVVAVSQDDVESLPSDEVIQRTIPEPPYNVTVESYNTDSIHLRWEPPLSNVFTHYNVTYVADSDPGMTVTVNKSTTESSLTGLISGETYNITIKTISGDESSGASDAVVQTTEPNSVVLARDETQITTDTIAVTWSSYSGDIVDTYTVQCSSNGTAEEATVDYVNGTDTYSAKCTGYETAGKLENITVTAVSGTSGPSQSLSEPSMIEIHTKPNSVVLARNDSQITNDTIAVIWNSNAGDEVSYYTVECSDGGTPGQAMIIYDNTVTYSAKCTGYGTAGKLENITVTAVSGTSKPSQSESEPSKLAIHTKPKSVTLARDETQITNDTIAVTWSSYSGDIVNTYTVQCSSGGTAEEATVDYVNDTVTYSAKCTGYGTAGKLENITVTAVSGDINTTGSESEPSTMDIHTKPNSVTLARDDSQITTDTIAVTWSSNSGDIVDTYTVQCSSGGTAEEATVDYVNDTVTYSAKCTGYGTAGKLESITVTAVSGDLNTTGSKSEPSTMEINTIPNQADPVRNDNLVTNTTIGVKWTDPGGNINHYEIGCPDGGTPSANVTHTPDKEMTAQCTALATPGGLYSITVTSVSGNSKSDPAVTSMNTKPNKVRLERDDDNITNDTIAVTWNSNSGDEVTYYTVECSSGGTAEDSRVDYVNGTDTYSAKCTGYETAGKLETITVTAVSGDLSTTGSESEPSMMEIHTESNAITLTKDSEYVTTTSIAVTWTNPGGAVAYYTVECSEGGTAENGSIPYIDNDQHEYSGKCINYNNPGNLETINVTSINADNHRGETSSMEINTEPLPVTDLTKVDATTAFIEFSWIEPESGTWSGYDVGYLSEDGTQQFSEYLSDDVHTITSHTFNNLTAGVLYDITVITVSGEEMSTNETEPMRTIPNAVTDLVLTTPNQTNPEIVIMWSPVEDEVSHYRVKCNDSDDVTTEPDDQIIPHENVTSLTTECSDLFPGRLYNVSVSSISGYEGVDETESEPIVKAKRTREYRKYIRLFLI
ncbi:receptor-type tyrosine-protein phosphatase beta-like [Saccoglossus kowalevskii]